MQLQHAVIVRVENLALMLAALAIYWKLQFSWMLFIYLIFIPDLGMLGYVINNKIGALLYNLTHTYLLPLLLFAAYPTYPSVLAPALIWIIHIGFDRAIGYGLKSTQGFKITHLSRSK